MFLRSLFALAGGVILALASEPVGLALLTPLGVAVLVLSLHGTRPRTAWLPGLAFGVGFFFVLLFWMRAVGWDAWLALAGVQAVYFAPLGSALALLSRLRWWPVWTALAWVGVETVRGAWPFGGMPWGRISYAVADTPWASGLPWLGFTGVSLVLALTGTTLAWLLLTRPTPRAACAPVAALVAVTLLPVLVGWDAGHDGEVTVAAVQGDVPGSGDNLVAVHRQVTANHVQATVDLALDVRRGAVPRPDFVVWPENSTAVDPFRDVEVNSGIERASAAIGVPILVGAMADSADGEDVLNQGIVWNPGLGGGDRYTKRHPVPFGEYIPWRDTVFTSNFGKLQLIGRDMLSGTRVEPLRVDGALVADAICFDVAYDDGLQEQVRRGAQMLTVQTSNAMFIHTHQIEQQFEITRLRAMETGRHTVVAATNGVTGVIGPDGSVIDEAVPRTTTVLVEDVALTSRITPAVFLGPWPGRLVLALSLLGCAGALRRRPGRGPIFATPTEKLEGARA
ncbi:apolipoprotein N-acyltransferase [Nocardioides houyundeii]|uniref:apolipoprotein N-acyltransferase n=1 Tax=Nocardioides houyundeii TaxID=2045452 RepID=UPI000DF38BBC|nr:apolipoprotein N-acyltransferase [Nocardioides houyundeii]